MFDRACRTLYDVINAPGVKLVMTCRWAPLQYEGTVDGYPAYFRSRHGGWRFTIAAKGDSAVWSENPDGPVFHSADDGDPDEAEAVALMAARIAQFRLLTRAHLPPAPCWAEEG